MNWFYMFAFYSFVNIFNLFKDLSRGVIRGHHNNVGCRPIDPVKQMKPDSSYWLEDFFFFGGGGLWLNVFKPWNVRIATDISR